MNIRSRLTLQFMAIVAAILLMLISVIYVSSYEYRKKEVYDRLRAKAATTAGRYTGGNVDSTRLREIDKSKRDLFPNESITIFDQENKMVYRNTDSIDLHITLDELLLIRKVHERKTTHGEYEVMEMIWPTDEGEFIVVAGAIDKFGIDKLQNLGRILIFAFLIGMLGVGITGWVFAGKALYPINLIVSQMQGISASNLQARLDQGNGTDEIARLAQSFNKMLTRLENAFNLQKTFVANISHELRNPLTAITAQLEVVLLRPRDVDNYQKTINSVLEDIKNLNRAAESLLELTRLNADHLQLDLRQVRLDELLWSLREKVLASNPSFEIDMDLNLPEDDSEMMVIANEHLLGIALANLMENGCKYSKNGKVKVSMAIHKDKMHLAFEDQGIGIAAEDLPHIFQPFYRGTNSNRVIGHGIGLSLVGRILDLHGAQVSVTSEIEKGSTFLVILPIQSPHAVDSVF